MQHRTEWTESVSTVVDLLQRVRHDTAAYAADGWTVCMRDELMEGGTGLDRDLEGEPLEVYAERVLNRTSGAESTRLDDQKMWREQVYLPHVSELPLGLGERFGHRGVRSITRADVRAWLRETERRPGRAEGTSLSASQVRQRFYLLRRIFGEALEDDAIEADPTHGVKPPALPAGRAVTGYMRAKMENRWLPTDQEMQQIIERMPPLAGFAVALAYGSGLRAGEVIALERRHVEQHGPQQWSLHIEASETVRAGRRLRTPTKTGPSGQGTRYLPIWVGAMIEEHLEQYDLKPTDRLLPSLGKKDAPAISYSYVHGHLTKASAEVHARITPNTLRAAGEASVVARLGRPQAAAWARHGLDVQMRHYVAVEADRAARDAAGWDVPTDVPTDARTG